MPGEKCCVAEKTLEMLRCSIYILAMTQTNGMTPQGAERI
jgi:hypothetical protein